MFIQIFFELALMTLFISFFIVMLGVHCGMYKRSYNTSNMSYLNSPLCHSLLSPFPHLNILFNACSKKIEPDKMTQNGEKKDEDSYRS
jgi:hypothetical protein